MLAYILRRLLFIIPTLFGIMVLNFLIVQAAPGGPIEQIVRGCTARMFPPRRVSAVRARAMSPLPEIRRCKRASTLPSHRAIPARRASIPNSSRSWSINSVSISRFISVSCMMIWNYMRFDFGKSYFRDESVFHLGRQQNAGVDIDRVVDDADGLSDLHPARHQEGGARTARLSICGPAP